MKYNDYEVSWGRQIMYSIETDNKARVRRDAREYEIRFGRARLEVSDWSDRQRELGALVFLPDDCGNQHQGSEISDLPALRYREPKLSYQGHQERPELGDTSMNRMSVIIWIVENITDSRKPPADAVSWPSRERKPCIEGESDRVLPLIDSEGRKPTSLRTLLSEF